jgi:Flp pilus assembly protein TadG
MTPHHVRPAVLTAQGGQATTEFVVLALVLVPLVLAVPLLGKYIDMIQTAEAASRYVAFEATVRPKTGTPKTEAEIAADVRRRFFSNSDAPVKTGDVAGNFPAHRNTLWTDGSGAPLLDKFNENVGITLTSASDNALPVALLSNSLGLSSNNLYTGQVTVIPAAASGVIPFDKLNIRITRNTVIAVDTWAASNAADVRGRVEGSAIAYPIGSVKAAVNLLGQLPTLVLDPALRLGEFDWDIVPCDRLVGGC